MIASAVEFRGWASAVMRPAVNSMTESNMGALLTGMESAQKAPAIRTCLGGYAGAGPAEGALDRDRPAASGSRCRTNMVRLARSRRDSGERRPASEATGT